MLSKQIPLGIYEKALPAGECWLERLRLAKTLGFDFVEMSVDETDARLARLDWSREQRLALVSAVAETGVRVPSMCLSAHRRFPLGSEDDAVRAQGWRLCVKRFSLRRTSGFASFNWRVRRLLSAGQRRNALPLPRWVKRER
ncbi:L-ribulose-5-phosphate 3-epimerase UlaE [Salmonella enterica subsp. enterica]|uniref:L-ribulose-5-phosphate 3-epimerase UlaE n=1 Tax=Salmonella enterica I TaxID=59201 RepID=A0A379X1M7_SALET|nr:L-ribulose-5-phosphate 3-epimerase UlaE [Salmonella enterica subsp. enterica]